MTTSADHAPRLVAGRYRLGAVLGRGSMGTVWSAHDEVLGRQVAIKEVLLPPGIPDGEADALRERSLREARAIAALSHPNVVTLYDVAREGGAPFVVMELVASHSLAALLREGPLPPQQAIAVGAAVAAALQAAHAAGITHRDVKPGNVLVAHDGRIKLTDFGIARNPSDQTMTGTGLMLGSPSYIAPEVASGGQVTAAADLWGLGATLFAAVEGRPAYDAGDPVATVSAVVLDEVPATSCTGPLAEVISGLMRKDPAARMPLSQVRRLLGPVAATGQQPAIQQSAAQQSAVQQPTGRQIAAQQPAAQQPAAQQPAAQQPAGQQPAGQQAAGLSRQPQEQPAAQTPPTAAAAPRSPRPAHPAPQSARPGSQPRTDAPSGQLAADPGPLPFAPPAELATSAPDAGQNGPDRPGRAARSAVWTLAVLLFLATAAAGFGAARIALGADLLPELATVTHHHRPAVDTQDVQLVSRVLEVTEEDGSDKARFTIGVPQGWPEFREQGVLGTDSGSVVRFPAPDGTELITVERATNFLKKGDLDEYLKRYSRQLRQSVSEAVEARREQLPDGSLDATFRTMEGQGAQGELRRTTYLRLVPAGTDLWVVRVSVPTEREATGRNRLFEPVVARFVPSG